jgi:hypothetical protein
MSSTTNQFDNEAGRLSNSLVNFGNNATCRVALRLYVAGRRHEHSYYVECLCHCRSSLNSQHDVPPF